MICLQTRKHWAIKITDEDGRVRFSPWFSDEEQALVWLNSPETEEDHASRFKAPMYCLQQYWEPSRMDRDLICEDYRYLLKSEGGWR